ncbi:hypothetical protein BDW59DRAFT_102841 [Aspergillus cavernicola]|uniref:Uncharacterized protein n=1 Tax=Aspergillus cavernicola TaxID=176166 RepID=A0ABR4I3J8_9EURO
MTDGAKQGNCFHISSRSRLSFFFFFHLSIFDYLCILLVISLFFFFCIRDAALFSTCCMLEWVAFVVQRMDNVREYSVGREKIRFNFEELHGSLG